MKKTIAVFLAVAIAMSAAILGAAFGLQKITAENTQKKHIELMETLLPGGKDFIKLDYTEENGIIRSVHKADKGYVIETVTQGYADEIVMYIGVDNNGIVTGLVAYEAHETYGLGNNILTDHKFLAQFLNKSGTFTIGEASDSDAFSSATGTTESTGNEIAVDGISGATVSSKAVARCVNAAVAYVTGADVESSATSWGG